MLSVEILMWGVFAIVITGMLALDLGILNRHAHALKTREAVIWSAVWISVGLLFALIVSIAFGSEKAMEYLAGYLIEKSLSVDNIFVFIIIFEYFRIHPEHQPKVLKWGILGAVLMRALLIGTGVVLIQKFSWMTYIFGILLLLTVVKMVFMHGETFKPGDNLLVRVFRRIMPITSKYHGDKFFIKRLGKLVATPLLLVVIVVESSDLIFAVDSIPAIFAVSTDPFIVYSSNIFAILGLRALYFVLAGAAREFEYLKPGIILVLLFVAVKMLIVHFIKIPILLSLLVIGAILSISIGYSIFRKRRKLATQTSLAATAGSESYQSQPTPAPPAKPLVQASPPRFLLNAQRDTAKNKAAALEE